MASHPAATLGDSSNEHLNAGGEAGSSDVPGRRGALRDASLMQQGMEGEMNRFHAALREARHELRDARRAALSSGAGESDEELREEDVLLRDSLVLLEVERTILDERLPAEAALSKVLEERRRLARLIAGASLSKEVASLERAFLRVDRFLDESGDEGNFPNARSSTSTAR